jgi:hypothetical protein
MDTAWRELLPHGAEWHTTRMSDSTVRHARHGKYGEPLWPKGIIGSITHAGVYRTVATAPVDRIDALGIDMEPLVPLTPAVWPRLFDATELKQLLAQPAPQRGLAALGRWCLKEALFKALRGRVPLDELPLSHEGNAWHLTPALSATVQRLGYEPARLALHATASDGWQHATAWHCCNN